MSKPKAKPRKPDVEVHGHGSVAMVVPVSPAAREWVDENVPLESWQWFGGGFAVEPRYLADLVSGMEGGGLIVH